MNLICNFSEKCTNNKCMHKMLHNHDRGCGKGHCVTTHKSVCCIDNKKYQRIEKLKKLQLCSK